MDINNIVGKPVALLRGRNGSLILTRTGFGIQGKFLSYSGGKLRKKEESYFIDIRDVKRSEVVWHPNRRISLLTGIVSTALFALLMALELIFANGIARGDGLLMLGGTSLDLIIITVVTVVAAASWAITAKYTLNNERFFIIRLKEGQIKFNSSGITEGELKQFKGKLDEIIIRN